jgi:hypothetical protein
MNITEHIKREYSSPKLTCTKLDSQISLELLSEPPIGPGEDEGAYNNLAPEYFNKNNPLNA